MRPRPQHRRPGRVQPRLKLADLLDTYETERRAVAEAVLGPSTRIMKKYEDGDADAHERPAEARQLGLSYRTAPPEAGLLAAGDRAPDAPLRTPEGKQVRLFDLFRGPHATTLGFGTPTGHALPRPEDPEIPGALVDVEGHAFAAYGAVPGTVVQVRPDGYVGEVRAAS